MTQTATKPIPYTAVEAEAALNSLDGWSLSSDSKAISKRYVFPNFVSALAFINRLGDIAEEQGHHPDITLGWGYAGITYTTHDIDGLHKGDFEMAKRTDEVLEGYAR